MWFVQTENLRDVLAQILDVIPNATNAKLSEIAKVFSDLGGIKIELFGKCLRRNALNASRRKRIQAAEINA